MTKKITQLDVAGAIVGDEILPIVQGAVTKRATIATLTASKADAAATTAALAGKQATILPGTYVEAASVPVIVAAPTGVAATDTAAIHAARDAAGVSRSVQFRPGSYSTTGLTASVAGQKWDMSRATITLANAANVPVIDVTANDVTLERGTLNGNRANQAGAQFAVVGVRARAVSGFVMDGVRVEDVRWEGLYTEALTRARITRNTFVNCGTQANTKLIYCFPGAIDNDDIEISGNRIEGWANNVGCIGIANNVAGRVFTNIRVVNNTCLLGNAGATPTLAIEMFTANGGSIKDSLIQGNRIYGELGAVTDQMYGVSVGGSVTAEGLGVTNVTVSDNVLRDCTAIGIEIIGAGVSATGNALYNSGDISVNATDVVGGLYGASVTGNTIVNPPSSASVIQLVGGTNGVKGVVVQGNSAYGAAGIGVACTGLVQGARIVGNTFYGHKNTGVSVTGEMTDSLIAGNLIDILTASAAANSDGILLGHASIARNRIVGNTIKGATRHGIYGLTASSRVGVHDNTIMTCASDGIRTAAGCDRWTIADNDIASNTGTGVILAGSPTLVTYRGNKFDGNGTNENLGAATFLNRGNAVLVGGTVTVTNTHVTADARVVLTRKTGGGVRGLLQLGTVVAGTSFVINSVDSAGALLADTSTIAWVIL